VARLWNEILDVPLNDSEVRFPVTFKTTMSFRPTANPRRTKLDALPADGGPALRASAAEPQELPRETANPRRTNLMIAPEPRTVQ
jgi:hypothetical protein